jgi:hypothetical protein
MVNARRYGDSVLEADLLNCELAKMIIADKSIVKKALLDAGIPVSGANTNSQLKDLVLFNIDSNKRLRDNIFEIIKKYNPSEAQQFIGADGKEFSEKITNIKPFEKEVKRRMTVFYNLDGDSIDKKMKAHKENMLLGNPKTVKSLVLKTAIITAVIVAILFFIGLWYYKNKGFGTKQPAMTPTDGAQPTQPGQTVQPATPGVNIKTEAM